MIAAGYKWLLFPYGLYSVLCGSTLASERPLEETWLSREGAEVFENR